MLCRSDLQSSIDYWNNAITGMSMVGQFSGYRAQNPKNKLQTFRNFLSCTAERGKRQFHGITDQTRRPHSP